MISLFHPPLLTSISSFLEPPDLALPQSAHPLLCTSPDLHLITHMVIQPHHLISTSSPIWSSNLITYSHHLISTSSPIRSSNLITYSHHLISTSSPMVIQPHHLISTSSPMVIQPHHPSDIISTPSLCQATTHM